MKKFLTERNIFACTAAVLGLVAVLLMFAPAIAVTDTDITYSGAQVTFGYSEKVINADFAVFKFSFMNFLTYILALAGIVFAVLSIFGKLGKISPIVSAVCFLLAGIFFLLVVPFCVCGMENAEAAAKIKEGYSLGAGAMVSGIISIISAVSAVRVAFIKQ